MTIEVLTKDDMRVEDQILAMLKNGKIYADIIAAGFDKDIALPICAEYNKQDRAEKEADAEDVYGDDLSNPSIITKDAMGLNKAFNTLGIDVRYNLRSLKFEYLWDTLGPEWVEVDKQLDVPAIQEQIAYRFRFAGSGKAGPKPALFSDTDYKRCSGAIFQQRQVDTFKVWLEGLPPWDHKKRVGGWILKVYDADNVKLAKWISQFLFCGAVARTYKPGLKLDETPILVGATDIGKSTLISHMLPEDGQAWFGDNFDFQTSLKEKVERSQGKVLLEAAEMSGSTRADINKMKAFLTSVDDGGTRLAYRADPKSMRRRFILVGTSNEPECLPNDPTGNRRFVPITVRSKYGTREKDHAKTVSKLRRYLEKNREQLWAEALLRKDESPRLPVNLKAIQAQHNHSYRFADQALEDIIGTMPKVNGRTLDEIAKAAGLVPEDASISSNKSLQTRLGRVLMAQGWDKRMGPRSKGRVRRYYHSDTKGEGLHF